ncbi:MAG: site-specific DNA-methyltransferase [Clostridia bacterium]|nr:site-specific DNA-methyltransferase [Selenomonadaceae bacterium]MBR4173077.1 site-specific DNA-methyltransferase [Clostridia bacterium]
MLELNKIYNMDCLEGMKEIEDGSVDMILCDLPHGTTENKWDIRIPFEPLWEQFKRITKKNAAICLFSQMPFGAELIMSNRKMFRYEWIWQKTSPVGFLNAHKMPLRAHENILIFYQALPTYNPQKTQGKPYIKTHGHSNNYGKQRNDSFITSYDGMRFPVDVQKFKSLANTATNKTHILHPTQKPTDLCEYLIKTYTNEGEVVFDACMGSGTTAVAAINTNRRFIGFELDAGYYEIALGRIEKARESLFAIS